MAIGDGPGWPQDLRIQAQTVKEDKSEGDRDRKPRRGRQGAPDEVRIHESLGRRQKTLWKFYKPGMIALPALLISGIVVAYCISVS
jgi:hypothetical protein